MFRGTGHGHRRLELLAAFALLTQVSKALQAGVLESPFFTPSSPPMSLLKSKNEIDTHRCAEPQTCE